MIRVKWDTYSEWVRILAAVFLARMLKFNKDWSEGTLLYNLPIKPPNSNSKQLLGDIYYSSKRLQFIDGLLQVSRNLNLSKYVTALLNSFLLFKFFFFLNLAYNSTSLHGENKLPDRFQKCHCIKMNSITAFRTNTIASDAECKKADR